MTDLRLTDPSTQFKGIEHATRFLVEATRELAPDLDLDSGRIESLTRESFRSSTLEAAGFHHLEDGPQADRFLFTVTRDDGSQIFIGIGKVSSGNPWEVMHASLPGAMDMRKPMTVVYEYDGQGKITEFAAGHAPNEYTGEHGTPEALLPHLRSSFGTSISTDEIG